MHPITAAAFKKHASAATPLKAIAARAAHAVRSTSVKAATNPVVAKQIHSIATTGEAALPALGSDLGRSAGTAAYRRLRAPKVQRRVADEIYQAQVASRAKRGLPPVAPGSRADQQLRRYSNITARQRLGPINPDNLPVPPSGRLATPRGWKGQTHNTNAQNWGRMGSNAGAAIGAIGEGLSKFSSTRQQHQNPQGPLMHPITAAAFLDEMEKLGFSMSGAARGFKTTASRALAAPKIKFKKPRMSSGGSRVMFQAPKGGSTAIAHNAGGTNIKPPSLPQMPKMPNPPKPTAFR